MPEPALCVVQFTHPGGEHHPDAPGIKRWNRVAHQRKFMRTAGILLDATREVHTGEVLLWGEWEPPSTVEALVAPGPDYPRYLIARFSNPAPSSPVIRTPTRSCSATRSSIPAVSNGEASLTGIRSS